MRLECERRHARMRWAENLEILKKTSVGFFSEPVDLSLDCGPVELVVYWGSVQLVVEWGPVELVVDLGHGDRQ